MKCHEFSHALTQKPYHSIEIYMAKMHTHYQMVFKLKYANPNKQTHNIG